MAKKSWFILLKRLFISETHSNQEKEKRRRWVFGRIRIKRLASVSAPSQSREGAINEAEEDQQKKHEIEAAAEIDSEVVWHQIEEETQEFQAITVRSNAPESNQQFERRSNQDLAATKIQTAFRGYLARKALRALKGLVRLQAIIRGRVVRRKAITTFKCLQSIVNIQSQVCTRRFEMVEGTTNFHQITELQDFNDKIGLESQRRWDDSILTKDEAHALFLSKREAAIKRERIKEYALSHRRSSESEENKFNGRWRYWLEQWVDAQLSKTADTVFPSNERIREEFQEQLKPRNSSLHKHCPAEGMDFPISVPRRSFDHQKKEQSLREENGFPSSPVAPIPTYMAATESAKARSRSLSSPGTRGVGGLDIHSDSDSPYKHKLKLKLKLSPVSSINSEVTSSSRIFSFGGVQQRSPFLKGLPGLVKSNGSLKDLDID